MSAIMIWYCWQIWLSAKRCTNGRGGAGGGGGVDFWLSIKSVSNTLFCCCFVCVFIIGQYHSGNNMSSKSGAAGEILFSESEKSHDIWPLKTDTLMVECFRCFHWCIWRIKTLPQSLICTEEILLYTVHIKLIITKFCFWSRRLRNIPRSNVMCVKMFHDQHPQTI